ncbi:MAG: FixG Ig-like domain-containing protein, partial [Pseudomonadota bacterium]
NVYTLRILNIDNSEHAYRISAEGIEGLRMQGDVERVTIESGQVRELVVRLQSDPANLKERSSHIRFRVQAEDSAKLVASEEARFLGPVIR